MTPVDLIDKLVITRKYIHYFEEEPSTNNILIYVLDPKTIVFVKGYQDHPTESNYFVLEVIDLDMKTIFLELLRINIDVNIKIIT